MSGFASEMFRYYSRMQKKVLEIIWKSAARSPVLQRLLEGYLLSVSALPSPTAKLGFELSGMSGECWVFCGM